MNASPSVSPLSLNKERGQGVWLLLNSLSARAAT